MSYECVNQYEGHRIMVDDNKEYPILKKAREDIPKCNSMCDLNSMLDSSYGNGYEYRDTLYRCKSCKVKFINYIYKNILTVEKIEETIGCEKCKIFIHNVCFHIPCKTCAYKIIKATNRDYLSMLCSCINCLVPISRQPSNNYTEQRKISCGISLGPLQIQY
jgi:hypothetical protein